MGRPHAHAMLVSEQDTVAAGSTFWVGVDLVMDEGWHVYWKNPGDSGMAPRIKWELPRGIRAGEIHWPYPTRINLDPLTSYGYAHEVLLLVPVTIDADFSSSSTADLHATVEWLTCKDMCVPGRADLKIALPVTTDDAGVAFNNLKAVFDQTRLRWPQIIPSISSHAVLEGDHWRLSIQTPVRPEGDIAFYPDLGNVIEHPALQSTQVTDAGFELTVKESHLYQGAATMLEGVAVNPAGWDREGRIKAIVIQAPIQLVTAHLSFWLACLFAMIGGLVLNLMPCVLPVLSIKVLHLVERHPDRKIALVHSMIYALGILVSVWALALLLFILKSVGQFAGWGFQFQSPIFVIVVAGILCALALNLFGVFEFAIPSIGGLPKLQAGYQASFISGVITTIVASPCTAPFMGTALTLAISQPNIVGFAIFTCLGLGLASPFVLLSAFPSLLAYVPKPGPWMVHLKQFFGAILIACVIWLLWVFSIQTGLGGFAQQQRSSQGIQWQAYSSTAVAHARQDGHGVFIDFTAAWCINCQVNDRLVLQNAAVVNAFKDQGIVAFKGDWTKYDPAITQALASYGRDSIPVYIYYPPGASTPTILPQLITPQMILNQLKEQKS